MHHTTYIKDNHRNWDQWIHEFRFAINSSWHESTNYTPAEIALGRKLKGPLKLFQYRSPDPDQSEYEAIERQQSLLERVKENVTRAQSRQQRYYNRKRRQETFQEGELVWVQAHPLSRAGDAFTAKLAPKWRGPAKVLKQLNNVNYRVEMSTEPKQVETYHVENLKRFYGQVRPSSERGGVCNRFSKLLPYFCA